MSISMIGLDFNKASVDIRSLFSFTKKSAALAMQKIKKEKGILGCVILSTCNRMELWVSVKEGANPDLYKWLCAEKEIEEEVYSNIFVKREGEEAVKHLFYLASGLKSQILAEDQILTQVKDALCLSREVYCTDHVLEVLFRMAVTAAKRVKTEVIFSRSNTSVIYQAIQDLAERGVDLIGKTCMVIGNGNMGRVTALALKEAGAEVTVTVRQYKSGVVEIPQGCRRINYGNRMEFLPQCDLVVSATASPNCTITKENFETIKRKKPLILIDLAVPRDIDPRIKEICDVEFYDIDSFKGRKMTPEIKKNMEHAGCIIESHMKEFYDWYSGRQIIPEIQQIKKDLVEDVEARIQKTIKKLNVADEEKEDLLKTINMATGKVALKIIFELKDELKEETFMECIEGLKKVYE